jgi:hypothetical protein
MRASSFPDCPYISFKGATIKPLVSSRTATGLFNLALGGEQFIAKLERDLGRRLSL